MIKIGINDIRGKSPQEALQYFQNHKDGFVFMGIPTLLFETSDFSGEGSVEAKLTMADKRWEQFKSNLLCNTHVDKKEYFEERRGDIKTYAEEVQDPEWSNAYAMPAFVEGHFWAHEYPDINNYKGPEWNIVCAPHTNEHANLSARDVLNNPAYQGHFPVSKEEEHVFTLIHELGHGVGADEPQTEKVAAIFYKAAFGNNAHLQVNAYLKVRADLRVLATVFDYNSCDINMVAGAERYSWPMTANLDQVISIPVEALEAITDDEIKNIRLEPVDLKMREVCNLGGILEMQSCRAFNQVDLPELVRQVDVIRSSKKYDRFFTWEDAAHLADRFKLACKRLHIGGSAYTNSEDPYDITPEVKSCADQMEEYTWNSFKDWKQRKLWDLQYMLGI